MIDPADYDAFSQDLGDLPGSVGLDEAGQLQVCLAERPGAPTDLGTDSRLCGSDAKGRFWRETLPLRLTLN
jgi:hypothetical protein